MPRHLLAWLLLTTAIAIAACLFLLSKDSPWTTEHESARAELEEGLEADRRYYGPEAVEHYRRALEIDPHFVMPKLLLSRQMRYRDENQWSLMVQELREVDPEELTSFEAFYLRYTLAEIDKDREKAERILDEYLFEHPQDPHVLEVRCDRYWRETEVEKAEACYRKILEIEPNWAQAENRLGYIAMGQGRFEEAEEHFRTYLFIAPDQANPHDSLGELLIVRGRYEEARQELEEALDRRPDFCSSYTNLVDIALYTEQPQRTSELFERMAEHCDERMLNELACRAQIASLLLSEDWERLAGSAADKCVRRDPSLLWMVHRGAVLTGELRLARKIEKALGGIEGKIHDQSLHLHLKGVRLCAEGEYEGAVASFEGADLRLHYGNQGSAMFKLFNRLNWAHALRLAGREAEAEKLIAAVAEIHPTLAEDFRQGEYTMPSADVSSPGS